jgi:hypothetical protein
LQGTGACVARAPYGVRSHPCPRRISRSPRRGCFIAPADRIRYEPERGTCALGARPHPPRKIPPSACRSTSGCVWGAPRKRRTIRRSVSRGGGACPPLDRAPTTLRRPVVSFVASCLLTRAPSSFARWTGERYDGGRQPGRAGRAGSCLGRATIEHCARCNFRPSTAH